MQPLVPERRARHRQLAEAPSPGQLRIAAGLVPQHRPLDVERRDTRVAHSADPPPAPNASRPGAALGSPHISERIPENRLVCPA